MSTEKFMQIWSFFMSSSVTKPEADRPDRGDTLMKVKKLWLHFRKDVRERITWKVERGWEW